MTRSRNRASVGQPLKANTGRTRKSARPRGAALGEDLRGLLEAAPDAMLVVGSDGRILLANRETERLFGYSSDELIGAAIEVLVPQRVGHRHVEHRDRFFKDARTRPMGAGLDLFGRRKDGTEFPAEISLAPTKSAKGMVVTAAIRDVTERKQADAMFRGLLEAAPDAIVIVGPDGRIVLVNAQTEKLFGRSRADLLGRTVEILIPERYHGVHVGHRGRFFRDTKVRAMGSGLALFGRRRDGTEFPVEISLSPLETDRGLLVSAAIRDVTDRKLVERDLMRAKEAAEAASDELEAFSYSVAHDLRAPLRSIDGFSQTLMQEYAGSLNVEARGYLKRVSDSAQHMAHLIDALLNLARINRSDLRSEQVDLSALARSTVAALQSSQPARHVQLIIADGLFADGDVRLLRAMMDNLLRNAWKFTSRKPEARIEFGTDNGDAGQFYFVRDNGAGFSMDHAAQLFKPFQRLHRMDEFEGTGIGLATVQRVVQRHGGRIWAQGTPGSGATFCFTLGNAEVSR